VPLIRRRTVPWAKVARRAAGATGLLVLGVGALGVRAGAQVQDPCSNYTRMSVLGSATGVRTLVSAPGRTIVTDVTGNLPGAQAQVDSVTGSQGWAGAPYVPVVAENAGYGHVSPNQIPVFASSSSPAVPQATNSTPGSTVTAKSDADSSTAHAEMGGAASDQAGIGQSIATAGASCASDASLQAGADTSTDMLNVQNVLRIGTVQSHALVQRDATGDIKKFEGTVAVSGVLVVGQAVAITDKGLVVGSTNVPLPGNPVADALSSAGITVRYLAADLNRQTGEVTAPGVEVSVTKSVPGGPPVPTTYDLGRAYARVSQTPGDVPVAAAVAPEAISAPTAPTNATPVDTGTSPAPTAASLAAPPARPNALVPGRGGPLLATAQIGSWSVAPAYAALGIGTVLLVCWVLLELIPVRSRWR